MTKEKIEEMSDDEALLYFLKHCSNDKEYDKIQMIKERRGFISMADKLYNGISKERHEELMKISMQMAQDRNEQLAYYEGFNEGKTEMLISVLESLLEKMPFEDAAPLLNISVEKAKELIATKNK